MHSNEGESMSTYHRRLKGKAFDNAVDVVELLHAPTDRVPNVRHLHVQHTFSSVTSSNSDPADCGGRVSSARRRGDDDDVLPTQGFA